MTKKEILDYVMYTPYNVNRQILCLMLSSYEEELTGGDIKKVIDKSIIQITNDAENIGEGVFENCDSLESANFPEVLIIGSYSFNGCTNLKNINFPKAIYIGSYAFSECGFSEADFPKVKEIDIYSFYKCTNLEKISFSELIKIGSSSFAYCPLETLILSSGQVCELSDIGAFAETPIFNGNGFIYVPSNLIESYKSSPNWTVLSDSFKPLEDYTEN